MKSHDLEKDEKESLLKNAEEKFPSRLLLPPTMMMISSKSSKNTVHLDESVDRREIVEVIGRLIRPNLVEEVDRSEKSDGDSKTKAAFCVDFSASRLLLLSSFLDIIEGFNCRGSRPSLFYFIGVGLA